MHIYSRWAQIKTFATGAQAGLVIGAFIGVCTNLEVFALTTNLVELSGVILARVTFGVCFAVADVLLVTFLVKTNYQILLELKKELSKAPFLNYLIINE